MEQNQMYRWNPMTYHQCRQILTTNNISGYGSATMISMKVRNPQPLPECLLVNTFVFPSSPLTTAIWEGNYITVSNNEMEYFVFQYESSTPQMMSAPDKLPGLLCYTYTGHTQDKSEVLYFKWYDTYYAQPCFHHGVHICLVHDFCKIYCYFFDVHTLLNEHILVVDVNSIIISFFELPVLT